MTRVFQRWVWVGFLAVSCSAPESDDIGHDDAMQWRAAPLRLEPGHGAGEVARLVIPGAVVGGDGPGWLVVEGDRLRVSGGRIGAAGFDEHQDGAWGIAADPTVDPAELPEELETEAIMSLDARVVALEGLTLEGYDRAVLYADRTQVLPARIVVDARGLLLDESSTRVFSDVGEASSMLGHSWGVGGGAFGVSPSRPRAGGTVPEGQPCSASTACADALVCVDPGPDDGTQAGVCLAICVASGGDTSLCVDDDGCCDDGVCNDEGVCIDPGGGSDGGSGGGTTQDGTGLNKGCGDSDDDGVCNALDQKPEESCSADADDDGCNDSCDADDTDSGDGCFGCRTPHVRRPNSTFWCLLLLAYCRGRRRRQKRTVTP